MSEQTVFITGASSGIGWATSKLLAQQNFRLILCGRRNERLKQLREELSAYPSIHTLCFDVRYADEVESAIKSLPENFKSITILINNAGNAHGLSPIDKGDIDDWDRMIDTNLKGLLYVTRFVVPQMVTSGKGHIINIGSIAGKEVYANGNVYNASKFGVDALGKGMLLDLNPHQIKVSNINPGLVATEFSEVRFKQDKARAEKVYQGYQPLLAEDVANAIFWVIQQPEHVNISDMTILPKAQASSTVVLKNRLH